MLEKKELSELKKEVWDEDFENKKISSSEKIIHIWKKENTWRIIEGMSAYLKQ